MTLFRPRISALCVLLAAVACKPNESGNIPCQSDGNCPTDYPQCIRVGAQAGKCTEAVKGTPQLAATSIGVNPGAITGGDHSAIALALPAVTGNANFARQIKLEGGSGGATEPVVKTDGTPLTVGDLGTTINVNAPGTGSADSKTYTYTLTVTNEPGSAASVTATGALAVIPAPVLSGTLTISPPSILGGLAPTLSVTLPALTSVPASAAAVSFSISGCGSGEVTKSSGASVALSDLGKTITIASPPTVPADHKTCTYTLVVSNAATTPGSAVATAPLSVGFGAGAVVKASGDGQFGKAGAALDNQFVVKVTDVNGAVLPNFPITWAVASGGGSLSATASLTDANGLAATTLTLGASTVDNTVTASAGGFAPLTFSAVGAGTAVKISGDAQFGKTGSALASPFVVQITDFSGSRPLAGFPVTWAVTAGGGSVSQTTTTTDANGLAATTLTTGTSSLANTVTATSPGFAALTFSATAAAAVAKISGDTQFGKTGTALANPFVVKVTDFNGSPVAGFPVAWAVTAGGGSLSVANSTTDGSGQASTILTPGASAIANSVTATPTGFSAVTFTATAAAAAVELSGDGQFGKTGTALANPFVVKVVDFNGVALSGFPVAWAVTAGGGSLTGTTSVTNGSGLAVTTLTLGTSAVANTVTATPTGFAPLAFGATAAGAAAQVSGDNQFGKTGTALANPFIVKVTDFNGAALAGFPVAWAVTAGGGSLSATNTTTDVNGLASTTLTPGLSAISNSVTATATGFTAITFTATAAAAVVKFSGDLQSGKSGTALANPFVVKATDFSGAALSGFPVTWAVATGGGTLSGTTSSTNGSGTAQTTLTLGAAGGSNSVTATSPGFSALTFTAAGANAIALNDGDGQTGTSGQPLATPLSVLVTDAAAAPVSGVTVTWAATSGGGSIPATSVTAGNGIASAIATLGAGSGSNTFTATITGLTAVSFSATAVLPPSFSGSTTSTPNLFVAGTGPTLTVGLPTITNFTTGTVTLQSCYPDLNTCTSLGVSSATLEANLGGTVPVTAPSLTSSTPFRTLQFVVSAQNSQGFTASGTPASVFVFPSPQGLNARRIGATATQLDSVGGHAPKVLIAGGGTALTAGTGTSNGACTGVTNTAELYDPETGIATAVSPALTQSRCMHTAVKVGSKVYFFGGADSLDIDVYDANAGTFATSSLPTMKVKRARHASLVGATTTKIYSIGGASVGGSSPGQTIEVFDTTAQTSTQYSFNSGANTSLLSTARIDPTATLMRNSIVIVGGESVDGSVDSLDLTATVQASSKTNQAVTNFTSTTASLIRAAHSAVALDTTNLIVAGGYGGAVGNTTTALSTVREYTCGFSGANVVNALSVSGGSSAPVNMAESHARAPIVLLSTGPNAGDVLLLGGTATTTDAIAQIDPAKSSGTQADDGSLAVPRFGASGLALSIATTPALNRQLVLIVGGDTTASSAELVIGP